MDQLTVFPIKNKDLWGLYKKQLACFWKSEEIDFVGDKDDFKNLNKNEQNFIKKILAFFAFADGLINANIEERFIKEVKEKEAKIAYDFQKMMENINGETYSLMLDNIIENDDEKHQLFNSIETIDPIIVISGLL